MAIRAVLIAVSVGLLLSGCGGQSPAAPAAPTVVRVSAPAAPAAHPSRTIGAQPTSSAPLVSPPAQPEAAWSPVASIGGQPAAWMAQRAGVTLMRFDQRLVHIALHAGSGEPSGTGWRYGDQIGPIEVHRILAAFNGGFRLDYGSVGFESYGRVAVPLEAGLGSIVTYRDGFTQIGAWGAGVPARGRALASVLQNLHLLVDHGESAADLESCVLSCWGRTLGGTVDVARSALGITSGGQLVWAAGESLSPATIARVLIDAGVQRAVELDINPEWVAGYLYVHGGTGPTAVPVVPGQPGIPGQLLIPYGRDFFTLLAN